MKPEETIDFHIRWAWARMSKAYNGEAAKHGATMSMAYALLSIDKDGTPSTKLGPKMGMEPTSFTRLLNTMEAKGYIKRLPDERDGRKSIVHITQKGKNYRDLARQRVIQLNQRIHQVIPANKLNVFFEVMVAINAELNNQQIFD